MLHIWAEPPRVDTNAIRFPSGDQQGLKSPPSLAVNLLGSPPFTGTSHMSLLLLFLSRSGTDTTKATVVPSGDIRGPVQRTMPMNASIVRLSAAAGRATASTRSIQKSLFGISIFPFRMTGRNPTLRTRPWAETAMIRDVCYHVMIS